MGNLFTPTIPSGHGYMLNTNRFRVLICRIGKPHMVVTIHVRKQWVTLVRSSYTSDLLRSWLIPVSRGVGDGWYARAYALKTVPKSHCL